MIGFGLGLCLGGVSVAMVSRAAVRTIEGAQVAYVDTESPVAVVLIAADRENRVERVVDAQTGHRGFSHVVVDCGEFDPQGRHLVYDCFPREGVRRVSVSERYGSSSGRPRARVRIVLPPDDGEYMRGAMAALLGAPYDVVAAIAPRRRRRGLVCSRLVMRGLPEDLAQRVTPLQPRHPIAPNDLARAFGVHGPNAPDVAVPARSES
mgnify:CR=1 FL=1